MTLQRSCPLVGVLILLDLAGFSQSAPTQPVRISAALAREHLTKQVGPPPLLGDFVIKRPQVVRLRAIISQDGTVLRLKVLKGHPILCGTAIEAAKQYRYKPFFFKGRPGRVQTDIYVTFRPPPEFLAR